MKWVGGGRAPACESARLDARPSGRPIIVLAARPERKIYIRPPPAARAPNPRETARARANWAPPPRRKWRFFNVCPAARDNKYKLSPRQSWGRLIHS